MILLAQNGILTFVALVAVALVIGWLLLRTHLRLSRHRQGGDALTHTARPERTDHGHHLNAPPDVARWEVQMHETARDLSAQLDSKMSALQALIIEADRATARLQTALDASAGKAAGPNDLSRGLPTQAERLRPSDGASSDSSAGETPAPPSS